MDKVEWIVVLSRWDIVKFLSKCELVDLSIVCKFVRNKLFNYVFKLINLQNLINYSDELPLSCIYTSECKNKALTFFIERIKGLRSYVKNLVYERRYSEILLLSIPQLFQNLSSLKLSETAFTLTTFHNLMKELNKLERLHLFETLFIAFGSSKALIDLQLPPSLANIKIYHGRLARTEYKPNLGIKGYLSPNIVFNAESLNFNIRNGSLPNLRILEMGHYNRDVIGTQNNLILASNQLTHFSSNSHLINQNTLSMLNSIVSLTVYNNFLPPQSFFEPNLPKLKALKELKIILELGFFISKELKLSFIRKLSSVAQNIEVLTLELLKFNRPLAEFLQNFNNLKESIVFKFGIEKPFALIKLFKSLKVLNLYNFDPELLDIINIKDCLELEFISIYYQGKQSNCFKFEDTDFSRGIRGWRVIHFPGVSIKCYKE